MKKPSVRQDAAPDFTFGVREMLEKRVEGARRVPPVAEWTLIEDLPKIRRKTTGFDPYNSLGNQGAHKSAAWRHLPRR